MSTHSYPPEEIPDKDCYPNCSLRAATFHPTPAEGTPIGTPRAVALPCTCHPDDNPPVPCAMKYALSDCRAASELDHIKHVLDAVLEQADSRYKARNGVAYVPKSAGVRVDVSRELLVAIAAHLARHQTSGGSKP